ncbi:MAG TPA: hypothetical protein VID47_19425 [Actinomycetota bacterium]|jgi:hypothetical protein
MSHEQRCPVCGQGVLQHLGAEDSEHIQRPESPIIETYSCGHEVTSEPLATADADRLEVERRASEETVDSVAGNESENRPGGHTVDSVSEDEAENSG